MGISAGDIVVNKKTIEFNNSGKGTILSNEQIEKNKKNLSSTGTTVEKPSNAKSILTLDKNDDGSIKYTFDNIYENKQLAAVAKDYYKNRDDVNLSDNEAIKEFISDRTWNQANTFAMGKEFAYITGDNVGEDQKARLSYLTRYWDELPNFYEEGGRGVIDGITKNLGVAILDPLNIFGGFVGGQVAKGVLKKAGQEVIKSQVKKGITKKQ